MISKPHHSVFLSHLHQAEPRLVPSHPPLLLAPKVSQVAQLQRKHEPDKSTSQAFACGTINLNTKIFEAKEENCSSCLETHQEGDDGLANELFHLQADKVELDTFSLGLTTTP